jgi:hypothetical protein
LRLRILWHYPRNGRIRLSFPRQVDALNSLRHGESSVVRRFGSGLLVLLLHLLILLALLHMVAAPRRPRGVNSREILLQMIRPTPPQDSTAPPLPRLIQPSRGDAQSIAPSLTAPMATPDFRGLGRSLFGCAPEALAGMTPEERSRCPGTFAKPDDTVVTIPQSHVKDPQRRAAEMRARNTPGRIPCSYIAVDRSFGRAVPAASLDCLADGIFGKGLAPLTGLEK